MELDDLFASDKYEDVLKFYDSFTNKEELIAWMRNRPSEKANIKVVEGDTKCVVVIPTKDFNGKLANHCKEIYKGLTIVFNTSSGKYWNYARAVNQAYEYAIKHYNPKWVIVSNDDIIKIDNLPGLILELDKHSDKALIHIEHNHNNIFCISKESVIRRLGMALGIIDSTRHKLFKKFGVKYIPIPIERKRDRLFYNKVSEPIRNVRDMFIINTSFFKDKIFDEVFINEAEDVELSLRVKDNSEYLKDFKVYCMQGSSLGNDKLRRLKSVASLVYLQEKIKGLI